LVARRLDGDGLSAKQRVGLTNVEDRDGAEHGAFVVVFGRAVGTTPTDGHRGDADGLLPLAHGAVELQERAEASQERARGLRLTRVVSTGSAVGSPRRRPRDQTAHEAIPPGLVEPGLEILANEPHRSARSADPNAGDPPALGGVIEPGAADAEHATHLDWSKELVDHAWQGAGEPLFPQETDPHALGLRSTALYDEKQK